MSFKPKFIQLFPKTLAAAILAASFTGLSSQSYAMDYKVKPEHRKTSFESLQTNTHKIKFDTPDYMKSSYKDFKINLVGPLNLSLTDDYAKRYFSNTSTLRANRVRGPFDSYSDIGSDYYRSTAAKTGVKFTF